MVGGCDPGIHPNCSTNTRLSGHRTLCRFSDLMANRACRDWLRKLHSARRFFLFCAVKPKICHVARTKVRVGVQCSRHLFAIQKRDEFSGLVDWSCAYHTKPEWGAYCGSGAYAPAPGRAFLDRRYTYHMGFGAAPVS